MFTIIKDMSVELISFGIGAGLSISFYAFFRTGQNIIKNIKDTPELPIDENLIELVKKSEELQSCIWGKVQANETPIHSIQNPKVVGVIWKHTIQEHIIAQIMGVWTNDKKTIDETRRCIPFSLVNDGVKVKVTNPAKFESVDLSVISEKFVSANNSLAEHLWGFVKGIRSTGTQYTEEMLVEGTHALSFGKLVYEKGSLHLKPHLALPYILTTKDKQGVIEDFESPLTSLKVMSVIAGCGTFYFAYRLGIKLHKHWKDFKKRRSETLVLEEVRQRKEAKEMVVPESLMCLICSGLRDILMMPCKHICICGECYEKLDPKRCPVCRTPVETIQPVFYS